MVAEQLNQLPPAAFKAMGTAQFQQLPPAAFAGNDSTTNGSIASYCNLRD